MDAFVVRGKIDPRIGTEIDVIFVFLFYMINMIIQCMLHHVASGSVNPVQSNVKCSKLLKFKFALLARCIFFNHI